jgi:hypothetical protein
MNKLSGRVMALSSRHDGRATMNDSGSPSTVTITSSRGSIEAERMGGAYPKADSRSRQHIEGEPSYPHEAKHGPQDAKPQDE